jgi:GNAT superfamily N-acetyltransferase
MTGKSSRLTLTFHPVTPDRWSDFAALFGENGACAGCWCMWWRRPRSEWTHGKGSGNRTAMRGIIRRGEEPGILAYDGERPVGWCAVAPREAYPGLARSRVLKPVDEQPVWSVTCFFIVRDYRRRGVSRALLRAAMEFARAGGGRILEGYPVEAEGEQPAAWVWTGLAAAFRRAGFTEVARRSRTRPIFRKTLAAPRKRRPRSA